MNQQQLQLAQFDKTTGFWGSVTMVVGLLLSLAGPAYLVFFTDLNVPLAEILTAFLAVALTFGVIWVTEPVTYYPMLGSASMYQAFMIGNISNKLLPAAMTAQDTVGAEPGSRKAEVVSVMGICGAALVHLLSLLFFVGILGNWLISLLSPGFLTLVSTYTLPAIMGAVLVQALLTAKDTRSAFIAMAVAGIIGLLVLPFITGVAPIFALLGTPLSVLVACLTVWALKKTPETKGSTQ